MLECLMIEGIVECELRKYWSLLQALMPLAWHSKDFETFILK